MVFPGLEYWSGLPLPSIRDFRDPGIKSASLTSPALAGRFFTTGPEQFRVLEGQSGGQCGWSRGREGRMEAAEGREVGGPGPHTGAEHGMGF